MIKLHLKKPTRKVDLKKVFRKAVKGYKLRKAMEQKPIKATTAIIPRISIGELEAIRGIRGVELPEKGEEGIAIEGKIGPMKKPKESEVDLRSINVIYPLIPKNSRNPLASVNIIWSNAENALIYNLIEPKLNPVEKDLLRRIKNTLVEKLDVDFGSLKKGEAKEYLKKRFEETVNVMTQQLLPEKRAQILYYVERDFIGLDKIEPMMEDPEIEDISCDGIGIPLYIYHRNPLIGSIRTNVAFDNKDDLDIFLNKLAQRCGKTVSVAKPLLGASLPDGSRVQATLGTDIARRGSNFTIRKFTDEPLTPVHLVKFKTVSSKIAAYLWTVVEYGRSLLITGGVATGKTSMLNALSLFIKPELKIVSIEDTPELRLPSPHWIPHVARQPIATIAGRGVGEVDLFDLLRESLRQRPDYLIVGEVRGQEAYVLFQQIATGHASMSTIHADSMDRLVDRLTTPPISLPPNLIEALDIVVFLVRIKYGNSYVRRVNSIFEIIGFDREKNYPIVNEVFRWDPTTDTYKDVNPSVVLKRIMTQFGLGESFLRKEIKQRSKVLEWMVDRNIVDYRDVARVVKIYYTRPDDLLDVI